MRSVGLVMSWVACSGGAVSQPDRAVEAKRADARVEAEAPTPDGAVLSPGCDSGQPFGAPVPIPGWLSDRDRR